MDWGRHFFRQIESNRPLTYRASTRIEGCQAGGLGHLLQEQGRTRFNSVAKTIHLSYLPIIYLWTAPLSVLVLQWFLMLRTLYLPKQLYSMFMAIASQSETYILNQRYKSGSAWIFRINFGSWIRVLVFKIKNNCHVIINNFQES